MAQPNAVTTESEEELPEEDSPTRKVVKRVVLIVLHILVIAHFIWATHTHLKLQKSDKCVNGGDNKLFRQEVPTTPETGAEDMSNMTTMGPQEEEDYACGLHFCYRYGLLITVLIIFYVTYIYQIVKGLIGEEIYNNGLGAFYEWWMTFSREKVVSMVLFILMVLFMAIVIVLSSLKDPKKMIAISTPIFFIAAGYIFSTDRTLIQWRTVCHGILFQFILGLVCIRWTVGREFFQCLGEKAAVFLGCTENGSRFVYGDQIVDSFIFAFGILAVIFFFSVVVSIMYYWGAMQWFLGRLGWLLQSIMGTTVCESVNAAANIFLGQSESPLLVRPYIKILTASEMHAIMVSGFATVAGTVLGAYISFGANPAYLITASVMAAPASLAYSKLYFPESEESQTSSENIKLEKSSDTSVLEAAASGATNGMAMVLGIVSNIVAFLAIFKFIDNIVEWLGLLIGFEGISLKFFLQKLFWPLAFMMGTPSHDCHIVSEIVAYKMVINEFIAYKELGVYIRAGDLDERSAGIATFAICGFANPGSLGILIAALSTMAPDRRSTIANVAIRAFFVGSIVSFISASFAGILITEDELRQITKSMGSDFGLLDPRDYGYIL